MTTFVLSYLRHRAQHPSLLTSLLLPLYPSLKHSVFFVPHLHLYCLKSTVSRSSVSFRLIRHSNPGLLPSLCSSAVTSEMGHLFSTPCSINNISYHVISLGSLRSSGPFLPSVPLLPQDTVTSASLTLFSPLGRHPAPPALCLLRQTTHPFQVYHLPLNCHTCYFSPSFPVHLFLLRAALADGYAIVSQSEPCAEY